MNVIYTKEELNSLNELIPLSLFNRIKRINGFVNANWDKYIEYSRLIKQGSLTNLYYISAEDIIFFDKTQEYFRNLIK